MAASQKEHSLEILSSNLRELGPRLLIITDVVLYFHAFAFRSSLRHSKSVTYGRQDYWTNTPVGEPIFLDIGR